MKLSFNKNQSLKMVAFFLLSILAVRKYNFYINSPWHPVNVVRNLLYKRRFEHSILQPDPNLIELCGQSNAVGVADIADVQKDLRGQQTGKYIFDGEKQKFELIEPGVNNDGYPDDTHFPGHFGVELRLMSLLKNYHHQNQYLIKYSVGSTQLAPHNIELDWSASSVDEYFDRSSERHFAALKSLKDDRPPVAFIWIQGENDANGEFAKDYQINLENFISEKRESYGYPDMPFIIVRLSNMQTMFNKKYLNVIRAAQENVCTESNNYLVNADNLPVISNVHYKPEGYDSIAHRIFAVIEKIKTANSRYKKVLVSN